MTRKLDQLARKYDAATLDHLIQTATMVPDMQHQLPHLIVALTRVWRVAGRAGRPVPDPSILAEVVEAAAPLTPNSDFVPYDAALPVVLRYGAETFRICPSVLDRPWADWRRLLRIAWAIDDEVWRRHQFGARDVFEFCLRWSDACIRHAETVANGTPDGSLSVKHLAAFQWPDVRAIIAACEHPVRVRRALKWGARRPEDLRLDVEAGEVRLGPVLALLRKKEFAPLAPALILLGLVDAIVMLAAEVGKDSEHLAWLIASHDAVTHLSRMQADLIGPCPTDAGEILCLMRFGERHYVAIDLVTPLAPSHAQDHVQDASTRLQCVGPGFTVTHDDVAITIPPDGEVVRVILFGGVVQVRGVNLFGNAILSLEDLVTINTFGGGHDFYPFVSELVSPVNVADLRAMDALDVYVSWQSRGGALARGIERLPAVLCLGHPGEDEWSWAATLSSVEVLLASFGWKEVVRWSTFELQEDGIAVLGERNGDYIAARTEPYPQLVFVDAAQRERARILDLLAQTVLWAPPRLGSWQPLLQAALGGRPLLVTFAEIEPEGDSQGIGVAVGPPNTLVIGWTTTTWEAMADDMDWANASLAALLVRGLQDLADVDLTELSEALLRDWAATPATFFVARGPVRQVVQAMPRPTPPTPAALAQVGRDTAAALETEGQGPQTLAGAEAADWLLNVLYPKLRSLLQTELARWEPDGLLRLVLLQLERISAWRGTEHRETSRQRIWPVTQDLISRVAAAHGPVSGVARAMAMIVEEVLASPPTGTQTPDPLDWQRLLAIANDLLMVSLHIDAIRAGLIDGTVEVDSALEWSLGAQDTGYVDVAAWQQATIEEGMRLPYELDPIDDVVHESPDPSPRAIEIDDPDYKALENAMLKAYGAGIAALSKSLIELQSWPVSSGEPIAAATPQELVHYVAEIWPEIATDELKAAIGLLTLSGADLRSEPMEHWKQESRRFRVTTRPLLQDWNGRIWVLPWRIGESHRIFVNYFLDHRLPWPETSLPSSVRRALSKIRTARNHALEDEVGRIAQEASLPARIRIAKLPRDDHSSYGRLPFEIDAVIAEPSRRRLWVVEAKDLYAVFSARQMRDTVDEFLGEFTEKVERKVAYCRNELPRVLHLLGIDSDSTEWQVRPIIVTRRLEPAAFARDRRVPIIPIWRLVTFLGGDGDPARAGGEGDQRS